MYGRSEIAFAKPIHIPFSEQMNGYASGPPKKHLQKKLQVLLFLSDKYFLNLILRLAGHVKTKLFKYLHIRAGKHYG